MMAYIYDLEKPEIFTERGQVMFMAIRDSVKKMLGASGAFTMGAALTESGSTWTMMACVDRLVELGEIREIEQHCPAGQDRVFVEVE